MIEAAAASVFEPLREGLSVGLADRMPRWTARTSVDIVPSMLKDRAEAFGALELAEACF